MQFKARLAAVRGTPSRADDARTVVRLNLEAHDIPSDWLFSQLGEDLVVQLAAAPPTRTPLEEAIDATDDDADDDASPNGAVVPTAGRRHRGTHSSERE